ncbi:alanine racemase [Georgenia sp. EYE_87]|uniref:alanine racemase n=1 Tax=Georgenia sp. EYE_87 TaxID=2853448 RepID=UPI002006BD02|nr:alanine racemase [Georgenia sp. EYE_87]MCK6209920.1 alanine racemase [Georgenia sp. EYE_87]
MSLPVPSTTARSAADAGTHPARAVVDLSAIRHNLGVLAAAAPGAQVMAVVKADAYGHGLLPVARAALAGGATWLGAAQLAEALELRAGLDAGTGTAPDSGVRTATARPRILTWLFAPGAPLGRALEADLDLSASAPWAVEEIAAAARATGRTARLHLKVDTGMGRGGARPEAFGDLLDAASQARAEGAVDIVGIWSHLACADDADSPATAQQTAVFTAALAQAERAGVRPEVRHLAASSGTLFHPATHFDLVRPGIAVYGLTPAPGIAGGAQLGLRPAMRLEARLTVVKPAPAGTPLSYGHTARTTTDTHIAVVPLGYGDGVPRAASDRGPVTVGGRRLHVAGRVCMDQVVVDLGPQGAGVREGDVAVLFGDGAAEPSADDWAAASGTINYEIVTRLGARVPRIHVDPEARP